MRRFYVFLVLPIFGLLSGVANAQNPFWTFPEQYWGGGINPATLPGLGNTTSNYTHAGILSPYGDIAFFKIDDKTYDKDGAVTSYFKVDNYSGGWPVTGSAEALVVPQPGHCDRFYIFQTGNYPTGGNDEYPYYSVYHYHDENDGHLEYDFNTGASVVKIEGNLIEEWYDVFYNPPHGVHYAATKEGADGVRRVFLSNNRDLYRWDLTCDGRPVQTGKLVKRP